MEERELTQLLQQLGDRVTPGAAPVRRIVAGGEALRGRRSGRVRMFAGAAAAAAVVGGGSVAAVVLDLPSTGSSVESVGGAVDDDTGAGSAPEAGAGGGDSGGDEGATAEDAVDAVVVTPEVARAGDTVQLSARDEQTTFGPSWRLERLTDQGWTQDYWLLSAPDGAAPTWRPVDEEPVPGQPPAPGPVTVVIPPAAAPGDYRVCQDDGTQDRCGRLTVVG